MPWGAEPAGFVYVAWHPRTLGYTKIGFTLWHPFENCDKYPVGPKRLQRIEQYLLGFGFEPLEKWTPGFHERARKIELRVKQQLRQFKRTNVGINSEIFEVDPEVMKNMVLELHNA